MLSLVIANLSTATQAKGADMSGKEKSLILGAGFLLGSLGVRALTCPAAKKFYVTAVSQGLLAKQQLEDIVEKAKANVDDIVAEANYRNAHSAQDPE
jgi:hypothetical protein